MSAATGSATAKLTDSWQGQSVLSFWQGVNWENLAIATTTTADSGDPGGVGAAGLVLSMELPVQKYFAAIPWSGVGEIAAVPQSANQEIDQPDEATDTLDDFLDDISQFF
jgi:hypothetical protein